MEIAYAVPFFFVLIGLELALGRGRRDPLYRLEDSVTNLSCGIGQQMLEPFLFTAVYGGYIYLQAHHALWSISGKSPVAWVVLFVGVDFFYYWFHRVSHRMRVVWATHVVHHQSQEYNLSVALRQSWLQLLPESVFYWPLALLGFPPAMFGTIFAFNTLYQFWIHTRVVGKLGPLEWIMNTPSHHRVHHGINPQYIDKNYAGVFIVWDRLFGTFREEREEPAYGTVKPLESWNPLWANIAGWVEIVKLAAQAPRFADKVKVWFMPPEWLPAELGGRADVPETNRAVQVRYAARGGRRLSLYVLVNFAVLLGGTSAVMFLGRSMSTTELAGVTALIVVTMVSFGALFEKRTWGKPLEAARVVAVVAVVAWAVVRRGA